MAARMTKIYRGNCRCGNIKIKFQTNILPASIQIRKCQCSFCVSHHAATTTDTRGAVKIEVVDKSKINRSDFSFSLLQNAGFLICNGCGAYAGAILDYKGKKYSTTNLKLFPEFDGLLGKTVPVDYSDESNVEKLKRRITTWTPTAIRFGITSSVDMQTEIGSSHGMIFSDVAATVGKTPLVELGRLAKGLPGRVVAKLEMRNPCGSVKDRLGVALIEAAERQGILRPGMTIIEATGGNTGIGLAFAAAIRGYRLILTMPESMSIERVALLRHLGAEVVLTSGILMSEAVARAAQLVKKVPGSVMLDQFSNPANPDLHRRTTAVEIWDDTQTAVDIFVSAVGTGGTITGVGETLKERKPSVKIIAVEPANAAVLSGGPVGQHLMPGIGVGFIPKVLNRSILDEVIAVADEDAFQCARRLAREEGILAGISSGAALHAALAVASRKESAGKMLVVLLADTAERYVSTALFTK